ncbi:hypothetical protein I3843_15G036000 [Carya illinoinensis]|nr:hypothetical protein I3843_15G036000 [Carya illinoinensis]
MTGLTSVQEAGQSTGQGSSQWACPKIQNNSDPFLNRDILLADLVRSQENEVAGKRRGAGEGAEGATEPISRTGRWKRRARTPGNNPTLSDICAGKKRNSRTLSDGDPKEGVGKESKRVRSSKGGQYTRSAVAVGDFNEILTQDEKEGGRDRDENQMELFREVVEHGQLFDLGWNGQKFTWSNRHEDSTYTKERLDRALADRKWKAEFSEHKVEVLPAICSDHSPILLHCISGRGREKQFLYNFKYEVNWSREEGCKELIADVWANTCGVGNNSQKVQKKLEACSQRLKQWSKNLIRDRNRNIREKTNEIKRMQRFENAGNVSQIKAIQAELNFLLDQEDLRWKQRAKKHWLAQGDRNSKFYHACVKERKKKNSIQAVEDGGGGGGRILMGQEEQSRRIP